MSNQLFSNSIRWRMNSSMRHDMNYYNLTDTNTPPNRRVFLPAIKRRPAHTIYDSL